MPYRLLHDADRLVTDDLSEHRRQSDGFDQVDISGAGNNGRWANERVIWADGWNWNLLPYGLSLSLQYITLHGYLLSLG